MPLSSDPALRSATDRVAEVFAESVARPDEVGCGRCYLPAEIELLQIPDAVLPAGLVELVAQEEPDHWEDQAAVIRRVLPQLVVILAEGVVAPDRIARGLAAAGWTGWPDRQAQAVFGFLEAWWSWTLRQDSPPTSAQEVFESCAIASSTVTPWLARWSAESAPSARRHASDCACWLLDALEAGTSPFAYWWGPEESERNACEELMAWLAVQAPLGRIMD